MDQSKLLRHVVSALEGAGVRYFITGSIASMAYGESRLTNDIDIVADLTPPLLPQFHLRDITGILKGGNVEIDRAYVSDWAAKLGLSDIWSLILQRVEPAKE
jgi:hypothetical protein